MKKMFSLLSVAAAGMLFGIFIGIGCFPYFKSSSENSVAEGVGDHAGHQQEYEKVLASFERYYTIKKENVLEPWTHNKTIQKCYESYRISKEQKLFFKKRKIFFDCYYIFDFCLYGMY